MSGALEQLIEEVALLAIEEGVPEIQVRMAIMESFLMNSPDDGDDGE